MLWCRCRGICEFHWMDSVVQGNLDSPFCRRPWARGLLPVPTMKSVIWQMRFVVIDADLWTELSSIVLVLFVKVRASQAPQHPFIPDVVACNGCSTSAPAPLYALKGTNGLFFPGRSTWHIAEYRAEASTVVPRCADQLTVTAARKGRRCSVWVDYFFISSLEAYYTIGHLSNRAIIIIWSHKPILMMES